MEPVAGLGYVEPMSLQTIRAVANTPTHQWLGRTSLTATRFQQNLRVQKALAPKGETGRRNMIKPEIANLGGPFKSSKPLPSPRANGLASGGVSAPNGAGGRVLDFFIESECWGLRYLIMESKRPRPGRKQVLLPPPVPVELDWRERSFEVSLIHSEVKADPNSEADLSISRQSGIKPRPSGIRSGWRIQLKSAGNRRILTFKPWERL